MAGVYRIPFGKTSTLRMGLFKTIFCVNLKPFSWAAALSLLCSTCCAGNHSRGQIPPIIWQTYKTKELPSQAKALQKTWIEKNPDYTYSLWDDEDIARYIHQVWDRDTELFFYALPLGVMKADLWRYLILATEGGIYSDVDSECCSPIDSWASDISKKSKHILLLGLENDMHFCQWTMAATAHHPAMKHVCAFLVNRWKAKGINIKDPDFVHATTGPGVWTEALFDYLGFSTQEAPPGKAAQYFFDMYTQIPEFKKHVNKQGIYLFSQEFYAGQASRNYYGSVTFGGGYVRWTEERDSLRNR